jgi:hypothetical protein
VLLLLSSKPDEQYAINQWCQNIMLFPAFSPQLADFDYLSSYYTVHYVLPMSDFVGSLGVPFWA